MKILDRFIIVAFLRPFVITFVVMVLFLLMQFVWVYIDDLVGRGVEWYYIAEMLFYASAAVVPRALTLSVLLSAIMTFGGMGENYELAAMKSSGLSLYRIMRPLIILMLLISFGAFLFSNYVIPVANLKSGVLLKNITNAKPALNIRQGVFYSGLEGYAIKIGEKFGEDKNQLKDIYIYDHSKEAGNTKVITADEGLMEVSADEQYLDINLYHGHTYEDVLPKERKDRDNYQFTTTNFDTSLIRFSLSQFQNGDMHEGNAKDFDMLNVRQLEEALDSLSEVFVERKVEFSDQMAKRYTFRTPRKTDKPDSTIQWEHNRIGDSTLVADSSSGTAAEGGSTPQNSENTAPPKEEERESEEGEIELSEDLLAEPLAYDHMQDTLLQNIEVGSRNQVLQNALRIARSNKAYYENTAKEFEWRHQLRARHEIEWHRKFSMSFTCLVLFFIGAPLGAIIRKGGIGMPVVVSVLIFLVYHVTSYSFEKFGRYLVWTPFWAMWTANFYLLPFGIFLTYKSANDSVIFNAEIYKRPFETIGKLLGRFRKNAK